jgi:hypothetical protein
MNTLTPAEIRQLADRLDELSHCDKEGPDCVQRNFHMSAPARPPEDADLVMRQAAWLLRECVLPQVEAIPAEDYHEGYGDVVWWRLPVDEPPYVGSPLDSLWLKGYYTHFTRLPNLVHSRACNNLLNVPAEAVMKAASTAFYEVGTIQEGISAAIRELANHLTVGDPPFGIVNEYFARELEIAERFQKRMLAIAEELSAPVKP